MARFLTIPAVMLVFLGVLSAQVPGGPQADSAYSAASAPSVGLSSGQNPLLGGIPTGEATADVLPLSFSEAINRGLRYNLGAFLSEQSVHAVRGARLLALSQLLPQVTAGLNEHQQQVNLSAFGFEPSPGMKTIVGPFNVFDVRAYVTQPILDFSARNHYRASTENLKAARLDNANTRDMVVNICANLYLQAVAGASRIDAARAQVRTAEVLYELAKDQKAAGVSPGIEVLRARVELQAQQQRLIVAEDQFAKDKLALARAIGLPLGQEFTLTDGMSYLPLPSMLLDETVQRAYRDRPDLQSAQARVLSAESELKAARAGRLPTLNLSADYGDIGQRPWESHGTFTVATVLRIPVFLGGSVRGRVFEADAALQQRKAELEDLRGRIYYDVRNAFLDLKAAADRVQVAQSAVKLADEQMLQSQDRFRAGVTNNVEVVQAQQSQATANENLISSLQAHSAAKLALARAIGISGTGYIQFLRGE
ncbi:MAG: TolC family protein [Acidobacteria bacterium]|nr:TolC family protein [Acidobacteriota bacterium]